MFVECCKVVSDSPVATMLSQAVVGGGGLNSCQKTIFSQYSPTAPHSHLNYNEETLTVHCWWEDDSKGEDWSSTFICQS